MINKRLVKKLPKSLGIYLFKKNNQVLYVGKSVNLKTRVSSHLEQSKISQKEAALIKQADNLQYILVDSEFRSLVLEAQLIKKYQPKFNIRWRDDKNFLYIKITTKEKYPKVFLVRKENDHQSKYFGPFSSKKEAELILKELRKISPYCTDRKIHPRACFYSKIGLCHPCPNTIFYLKDKKLKSQLTKKYQSHIGLLIEMLKGDIQPVVKKLNRKIGSLVKDQKFEEAIFWREKLKMINYLQIKKIGLDHYQEEEISSDWESFKHFLQQYYKIDNFERIEGYDVSNLSFKEATASMVVFTDGLPDKSQYRRFAIKNKSFSDTKMIVEVIARRLENKWPLPNLLVIDGGTSQLKAALMVVNQSKLKIPVVSIAKDPSRLLILKNNQIVRLHLNKVPGGQILIALIDEAHRFAKKYHLLLRNKKIFNHPS